MYPNFQTEDFPRHSPMKSLSPAQKIQRESSTTVIKYWSISLTLILTPQGLWSHFRQFRCSTVIHKANNGTLIILGCSNWCAEGQRTTCRDYNNLQRFQFHSIHSTIQTYLYFHFFPYAGNRSPERSCTLSFRGLQNRVHEDYPRQMASHNQIGSSDLEEGAFWRLD